MIEVEHVSYTYRSASGPPTHALRDVSLTIAPGEYVALVGHNGSGKSTLAKLLNGLLRPTAGRVLVDGMDTRDPTHLREIRRRVGMVFQDPDDQIVATVVEEDVAFGPENLGLPRDEIRARVAEALEIVGLAAQRHRPPHMLSAGQRQRVAIAGVLAMAPRYLILDEATAMLDPQGRHDVLEVVRRLHQVGIAVVHITHVMEEAAEAERVVVLDAGCIVADSPARKVFAQVETLRDWGLEAPPVTQLARRLHLRFSAFPRDVLTVEELVEAVTARISACEVTP